MLYGRDVAHVHTVSWLLVSTPSYLTRAKKPICLLARSFSAAPAGSVRGAYYGRPADTPATIRKGMDSLLQGDHGPQAVKGAGVKAHNVPNWVAEVDKDRASPTSHNHTDV